MKGYFLSEDAENDLIEIYLYTDGRWGEAQAQRYLNGLYDAFKDLVSTSKLGRKRPELGRDTRSLRYHAHTIFYRIEKDEIAILRVLHGSRDVGDAPGL